MKIVVIGLGLIGGSIAKDLKRVKFASQIIGVDASKENLQKALELGIADVGMAMDEALRVADLVVVAIPVDKIRKLMPYILDHISDATTVTDVGSTKKTICDEVDQHPRRGNYVPAHPMSGTENSGPDAAIECLFENKITIICDQEKARPQHLALVEKLYHAIGMDIAFMSADEQDHTTANVSHLPHVTAYALANAVLAASDRKIIFDLASGGFRSTARLAKSSPEMWGPIFKQNSKYVVESLEIYIHHLNEFKESIENKDETKMYELMHNANRIRTVLEGESNDLVRNEEKRTKYYTRK